MPRRVTKTHYPGMNNSYDDQTLPFNSIMGLSEVHIEGDISGETAAALHAPCAARQYF